MSSPFKLVSTDVFVPAPAGACVWAESYYTRPTGTEIGSLHRQLTRSDTIDIAYARHSSDNGRNWTEPLPLSTREELSDGVLRRFIYPPYLDPASGRLLQVNMEGLLAGDNPHADGPKSWRLHYSVYENGGDTPVARGQAIQRGTEFNAMHPFPGHWVGRNAIQIGATTCVPITLPDGRILVPGQITPVGPDGQYINPGGGHTYHEVQLLRVTWGDDGTPLSEALPTVKGDPARTTRGLIEPTLAHLADGRILMVMRASNDVRPELPGHKWACTSSDAGESWTDPVPWTYDDGEAFHSPSSCSQLLPYPDGHLFWLGNISPENPRGNAPRYPLVIGEVDAATGLLRRDSIAVIDTRRDGESDSLQLSNFYVRLDRETGDILVHCSRMFANHVEGTPLDWTADALLYRIAVS